MKTANKIAYLHTCEHMIHLNTITGKLAHDVGIVRS